MWAEKPYSVQADIFSLGVSFMVLLFKMDGETSLEEVRESYLHNNLMVNALGKVISNSFPWSNFFLRQVMGEIHTLKENGSTGRSLFKKAKDYFDTQVG